MMEETTNNKKKRKGIPGMLRALDVAGGWGFDKLRTRLPFILFIVLLALIYIGNHHLADRKVKAVNAAEKRLNELKWEHVSLKSELDKKSRQSEVAGMVEDMGLIEITKPPKVIQND